MSVDTGYRQFIPLVFAADAERLVEKDIQYGASWLRRGGTGAFHIYVRKPDRLEAQVSKHGDDVFKAIEAGNAADGEGVIDTIRDARGYLALIEAEAIRRGIVPVPVRGTFMRGEATPKVMAMAKLVNEVSFVNNPSRTPLDTVHMALAQFQEAFSAQQSVAAQQKMHTPSEHQEAAQVAKLQQRVVTELIIGIARAVDALELLGALDRDALVGTAL